MSSILPANTKSISFTENVNIEKIKEEYLRTGLIPEELKKIFQHQHYVIVGNHSAVEICSWTKKSLTNRGFCYKQKFYGIRSHLCCQMTPSVAWCDHLCIFCWRATHINLDKDMSKAKIDDPKTIIEGCILAQRKLLSGFGGNPKVDRSKLREAQEPMHFAISLSGEPTLYPKLPELIQELHKKGKTTFLVSNGQHPEMIEELIQKDLLPTQLYISVDAPNEELYKKIDVPLNKNGWQRLMKTLEMIKNLSGYRTVLRITLIKGINDLYPEKYAELIQFSRPMFVEVKAYMWVGHSRKRLKFENMPSHKDIMDFSKKIAKFLKWEIIDEKKESRVALIMERDIPSRIMSF
ncbi:MAG: 4-demethylwyosine synthase TYW1 [Candidatus Woesearchaeota archaeon]